ncbi:MAG: hypothetical protein AAFS10_04475 [Myxococcota bacterium]
MNNENIPKNELEQRVIYALLLPAVRLAHAFGVSLKDLRSWVDTAYFHELRSTGLTHQEIADALRVSKRTAVNLSRQAREQFIGPNIHHNLPRRIEFMLGAEPMGQGRVHQLLPEAELEDVQVALRELLEQGRIRELPGRTLKYEPAASVRSLPRDTWMARIGGLNSFSENLTNAVFGRFFRHEPRTFARTLTFRGRPGVFRELTDFYTHRILPGLQSMHVETTDQTEPAQVSLCWAPYEYMNPEPEEESAS